MPKEQRLYFGLASLDSLRSFRFARIRTYVRTFVRTYVRTYILTYVRTYVRTYVCTYVRTYIRTYEFKWSMLLQRLSDSASLLQFIPNSKKQ